MINKEHVIHAHPHQEHLNLWWLTVECPNHQSILMMGSLGDDYSYAKTCPGCGRVLTFILPPRPVLTSTPARVVEHTT